MKTLDEFDFSKAPQIAGTKIHELRKVAISNAPNQ